MDAEIYRQKPLAVSTVTIGARTIAIMSTLSRGAFARLGVATCHLAVLAILIIDQSIHLTVSVQRLDNSGFIADELSPRNSIVVGGLRFHYAF